MRFSTPQHWLCALALSAHSFAVQAMDVEQLLSKARATDASYLVAVARAREIHALADQARGGMLPQINASLSASNNNVSQLRDIAVVGEGSSYGSENQTISVRQQIWRPALSAEIDAAQARLQSAQWTVLASEIDLTQRMAAHLFDRFSAIDQQKWIESKIVQAKGVQASVEMRVQQGLSAQISVLEAQADIFKLEAQLQEALVLEAESVNALIQMTGGPITLTDSFPFDPKAQILPIVDSLADWLQKTRMHASIRAQEASLEAARYNVKRYSAGHVPTVEAFAQVSKSLSENLSTPGSGYLNRQIGISISIPLYSGGSTNASIRAAQWNLEAEHQRLADIARVIEQSTQIEFNSYKVATANLKAAYAQWLFARASVESTSALYEGGFKGINDLLQVQSAQLEALKDWRQSLYRANLALLKLKLMSGESPQVALREAFGNQL